MMTTDKQRVKELLIATKYGVSAAECPMIVQVAEARALAIIEELIRDGEDIHSLAGDGTPEHLVLYSIGPIDESI
uniref:hypothetical protein n=1 Tax=Thaumasiovibrio occultus TaxID=1891184 RepID=UPI000B34BD5E|nr:hypothetical protein [Thaumasiovibrio occultus]